MIKLNIEREDLYLNNINTYKKTESIESIHCNKIKKNADKTIYKLKEYPSSDDFLEKYMIENNKIHCVLKDELYDAQTAYCKYILANCSKDKKIILGDTKVSEYWLVASIMDGIKPSQLAVEVFDKYDGQVYYAETHTTSIIRNKRKFILKQVLIRIKDNVKYNKLLKNLFDAKQAIDDFIDSDFILEKND